MIDWVIARLDASHDRTAFHCGNAALDQFLTSLAGQYERRGLGVTYVATAPGEHAVAGYYTMASSAVDVSILPAPARKRLPKHPVPAIHLGRLAVDQSRKAQGLGAKLLLDCLRRSAELSHGLGVAVIDVWAIDENARSFYLHHDFLPLADDPYHLYLPMATVKKLFTL
jgi:GNAT superfamily N-acetyltransferase